MIDARGWARPAPDEVRALVERTGYYQREVGYRLGVGERRVRHWVAPRVDTDGRRISFCEHMALLALVEQAAYSPRPHREGAS